eukprot:CAMPEP_0182847168 /NCGR_PEP_ID=MMETSP0006_2-20121128/28304_1 /TAXON_ID=97485 /ORGANISM="Prymnesium parvum, Strain Texoma1" /LENGTH=153 /DNA_ID=CAMNT_0024977463 /DNA_START=365 /DNA_END=828 /DNA_ORIENTATION=+
MDEASRTEASLERVLLPFARAEACSAPAAWMRDELVRSSRSDARRNVRAASLVLEVGDLLAAPTTRQQANGGGEMSRPPSRRIAGTGQLVFEQQQAQPRPLWTWQAKQREAQWGRQGVSSPPRIARAGAEAVRGSVDRVARDRIDKPSRLVKD